MASPDPSALELLSISQEFTTELLSGSYKSETAVKWYMRVLNAYRKVYGEESHFFKDLVAFRPALLQKTVTVAEMRRRIGNASALRHLLAQEDLGNARLPPEGRKVFLIHGHDELNTLRLQAMLKDDLDVDVVLIMPKAGLGRTIIEKFEQHANDCSYAVALFTPDDAIEKDDGSYLQARPNVIFETGWFVGRLGKERALILLKKGTRIYSDFDGVSRIEFREDVREAFRQLQAELRATSIIE
jgi:predicted nucleotide-binding protein